MLDRTIANAFVSVPCCSHRWALRCLRSVRLRSCRWFRHDVFHNIIKNEVRLQGTTIGCWLGSVCLRVCSASKISGAHLRECVQKMVEYATVTKKRNFLETVELQVGLKNYDTRKDKRFKVRWCAEG